MNTFKAEELKILTLSDSEAVLRAPSKHTYFKEVLHKDLFDRLREANSHGWTPGVGVAAVQIGVLLRVAFYMDPTSKSPTPRYLINPDIHSCKEPFIHMQEGCLSIPGKRFNVWRYQQITYTKIVNGKAEQFTVRGLEAVIVQHEVDHMNGVLCCDRLARPPVLQRNNLCACGSGKKYKKCCLELGLPYPIK